ENIESLSTELEIVVLADFDPLEQRCVEIEQARPTQRPARHVPEGSLWCQHERFWIKPLIRFSQNHRTMEIRIPVGRIRLIGVASPRSIEPRQRREWKPALPSDDPVPLPTADQFVQHSSRTATEALPAAKGQLITEIRIELMGETVRRDA